MDALCAHCRLPGVDSTCPGCGIQTHSRCLDVSSSCDVCHFDLKACYPNDLTCQLCMKDTGTEYSQCVVFFGKEWKKASSGRDYDDSFRRVSAPTGARCKMVIESDEGVLVATPYVAHTLCAQRLFQVSSLTRDVDLSSIREAVDNPTKIDVGGKGKPCATFQTHRCIYCRTKFGWTTFCTAMQKGTCRSCADFPGAFVTNKFFHPMCAQLAHEEGVHCSRDTPKLTHHAPDRPPSSSVRELDQDRIRALEKRVRELEEYLPRWDACTTVRDARNEAQRHLQHVANMHMAKIARLSRERGLDE